ncbi:hypothetical protein BKH41_02940 [Helicobacter sp. 12S02232-10]|uniref:hypothetical protein n=1 Tax=Helicobacter sp. 12S02232-10 TaxID=1476197 RepID=UPI000BA55AD4|nr:hypothetical protein [Helicobacter sp. 12S02232-10]PAF49062.1 hypothetical protein BKH41_02940 [Helicobacter sp. 12S02232-10]
MEIKGLGIKKPAKGDKSLAGNMNGGYLSLRLKKFLISSLKIATAIPITARNIDNISITDSLLVKSTPTAPYVFKHKKSSAKIAISGAPLPTRSYFLRHPALSKLGVAIIESLTKQVNKIMTSRQTSLVVVLGFFRSP